MANRRRRQKPIFIACVVCALSIVAAPVMALQSGDSSASRAIGEARILRVDAECSSVTPGARSAVFQWELAQTASRVEIDITQYFNSWATEQFETITKFDGSSNQFEWSGGEPGIDYLWRVGLSKKRRWR